VKYFHQQNECQKKEIFYILIYLFKDIYFCELFIYVCIYVFIYWVRVEAGKVKRTRVGKLAI